MIDSFSCDTFKVYYQDVQWNNQYNYWKKSIFLGKKYLFIIKKYRQYFFKKDKKMGSTHHHHYTTQTKVQTKVQTKTEYIYQKDPQIVKQLAALRAQLNDPKKAPANILKMKEIIFKELASLKFPKNFSRTTKIFIGRTSAGKSSLLNTLFKLNLATSKGSCTQEITPIGKFNTILIFDCPGFDTHFEITKNPELIPKYLGNMDEIYYLYDSVVEEDIVKICLAMKKKIFGVRTKCDPDEQPQENQEIKVNDCAMFHKYGVVKPMVFLTSKKGGSDNGKLLSQLLSS